MAKPPPKRIVILGTAETAEVLHFYLTHDSDHEVVAFTNEADHLGESRFAGLPVVPFETVATAFPPEDHGFFVAVGYTGLNQARARLCAEAAAKGYPLISYVSSKAHTWPGLSIGANSFVMEANTVQPFVHIGDHAFLWSGNHIGHHARIGDNVFVASQAVIAGHVTVGAFSFIGVNSTIRDGVTIGKSCIIGAGALVLEDARDHTVYPGEGTHPSPVPSHRVREI